MIEWKSLCFSFNKHIVAFKNFDFLDFWDVSFNSISRVPTSRSYVCVLKWHVRKDANIHIIKACCIAVLRALSFNYLSIHPQKHVAAWIIATKEEISHTCWGLLKVPWSHFQLYMSMILFLHNDSELYNSIILWPKLCCTAMLASSCEIHIIAETIAFNQLCRWCCATSYHNCIAQSFIYHQEIGLTPQELPHV